MTFGGLLRACGNKNTQGHASPGVGRISVCSWWESWTLFPVHLFLSQSHTRLPSLVPLRPRRPMSPQSPGGFKLLPLHRSIPDSCKNSCRLTAPSHCQVVILKRFSLTCPCPSMWLLSPPLHQKFWKVRSLWNSMDSKGPSDPFFLGISAKLERGPLLLS